jgi:hypothetical protein
VALVGQGHGDERPGGQQKQIPFPGKPVLVAAPEAEGGVEAQQRHGDGRNVDAVAENAHEVDILRRGGLLHEADAEPEQHDEDLRKKKQAHVALREAAADGGGPEEKQRQIDRIDKIGPHRIVRPEAHAELPVKRHGRQQLRTRPARREAALFYPSCSRLLFMFSIARPRADFPTRSGRGRKFRDSVRKTGRNYPMGWGAFFRCLVK